MEFLPEGAGWGSECVPGAGTEGVRMVSGAKREGMESAERGTEQ